jgi:hypothetical protein
MLLLVYWASFLLAQNAGVPVGPSTVSWASELNLSSLSAIDGLLSKKLDDMPDAVLADNSIRPIKTCRDLLALEKVKFDLSPDTADSWDSLTSEAIRCSALDVLRTAKPASVSYLGWFKLSRAGVPRLPARFTVSFSDDAEKALRKADQACQRWDQFDPSLKVRVKGEEAEVRTDGWSGRLVLYARGDLTGDGIEDLMFLREGKVKGGTATGSLLLIVTQTSEKACPRVLRTLPESLGMGRQP